MARTKKRPQAGASSDAGRPQTQTPTGVAKTRWPVTKPTGRLGYSESSAATKTQEDGDWPTERPEAQTPAGVESTLAVKQSRRVTRGQGRQAATNNTTVWLLSDRAPTSAAEAHGPKHIGRTLKAEINFSLPTPSGLPETGASGQLLIHSRTAIERRGALKPERSQARQAHWP